MAAMARRRKRRNRRRRAIIEARKLTHGLVLR